MIRLSPAAESDLRSITGWIRKEGGADVSLRVHDRIVTALRRLATFPLLGRTGRVADTRELVIGGLPYIAIYRQEPGGVLVLRIMHGAQQWPQVGDRGTEEPGNV